MASMSPIYQQGRADDNNDDGLEKKDEVDVLHGRSDGLNLLYMLFKIQVCMSMRAHRRTFFFLQVICRC